MPNGADTARSLQVPWLKPSRGEISTSLVPVWSVPAAMRAARATIVVCGLFALTDQVFGNLQMATFAAFGGFATLVMASFAGTRRDKLLAHMVLAVAGSALLTIGTAVNSSTALAAIVTIPVAFLVFFAGICGANAASGSTAALLAYVLPAASPGTISMVPDRLAGWWLASVAGTAAVLLLSPGSSDDALRAAASRAAAAIADALDAALGGTSGENRLDGMIAAKRDLLARFTAAPYRSTGLAAADQALANSVELLEWCTALVADSLREHADSRDAPEGDRELLAVAASVLRDVASVFAGDDARPDLERLERCRTETLGRLRELTPDDPGFREEARIAFHANAIAVAVLGVGADALVAARRVDPEWVEARRQRWYTGGTVGSRAAVRVSSLASAAITHASVRSVWFVNSLRGAVALAAAIAVADLVSVQHGFWVVLGTLSVLRSNAAATGATALRALLGTAVGFVVGGALLVAIGTGSTTLWAVLPIAVCIAGYAPGTAPFAVGQAAFTVTIVILFNLLAPVGWKVGVVRIEDVAIGCAVSLAVGMLIWPRGVSGVVGDDLADAFRAGAAYLRQAVEWAIGLRGAQPDAGMGASTAGLRLDEGLRGFLAEQGSKRIPKQDLWRLVGGSLRLRLTARAVADLPHDGTRMGTAREVLDQRTNALTAWYEQLADVVGRPHGHTIPSLSPPAVDGPPTGPSSSYYGIWLCEQLTHLTEHLPELVAPATRVGEVRRRPWWR
jgi:Fusaric acid resistance protein-like